MNLIDKVLNLFRKNWLNPYRISFKETYELTGMPLVTFYHNNRPINFLIDTGASRSIIDKRILPEIEYNKVVGKNNTVTGVGGTKIPTTFINTYITYKNKTYIGEFQIMEKDNLFDGIYKAKGIKVEGVIGTEFLDFYGWIIDFRNCVIYINKSF